MRILTHFDAIESTESRSFQPSFTGIGISCRRRWNSASMARRVSASMARFRGRSYRRSFLAMRGSAPDIDVGMCVGRQPKLHPVTAPGIDLRNLAERQQAVAEGGQAATLLVSTEAMIPKPI